MQWMYRYTQYLVHYFLHFWVLCNVAQYIKLRAVNIHVNITYKLSPILLLRTLQLLLLHWKSFYSVMAFLCEFWPLILLKPAIFFDGLQKHLQSFPLLRILGNSIWVLVRLDEVEEDTLDSNLAFPSFNDWKLWNNRHVYKTYWYYKQSYSQIQNLPLEST